MRNVGSEFLRRLKSLQQTEYDNAAPRAVAWITRPTTALTEDRFLDKQRVGIFSGLSASSIAARRTQVGLDVDRVYIAYVADGKARVKYADANPDIARYTWQDAPFEADATDVAIAFDGKMPRQVSGSEFVTDSSPWVFWVTDEGAVKGRILGLLGDTTLAASGATAVSAIRATWQEHGGQDFGLCVFMLLGGALYYRQLIDNEWSDAVQVSLGPSGVSWVDIAAFRTWDYRVGVQALGSDGKVYELFTQYQGFGRHGSEHLEVVSVGTTGNLTEIEYHDAATKEHVTVASVAVVPALYGGLYKSGAPQIVSVYNIADDYEDWGKTVVVRFDRHLVAADVAAQPGTFSIVDSRNTSFVATSAALQNDGLTIVLGFVDFNNAKDECDLIYTPGTVASMAGTALTALSFEWTPENLVPSTVPAPEVYSVSNTGHSGAGLKRVRFYDTPGITLLHTEYVQRGGDCAWGYTQITIDVTPPVNSTSALKILVACGGESESMNIMPAGSNTSFGYNYSNSFTLGGIAFIATVSGGYNGGAVISISADGSSIFTSTASDTYNLNYNNTHAEVSTQGQELWAITTNTGIAVSGITENVQTDLDLYVARWTVNFYNKSGQSLEYTEYVVNGEDCTWSTEDKWATTPNGSAVTGATKNIVANIDLYDTVEYVIVPWATGTDAQIVALIQAAHNDGLDLQADVGWAVGDTRTIHVDSFTGNGVLHPAQDIDIVITSFADYNSCGAVMQFDFKQCFANSQKMHTADSNVGGYAATAMYTQTLPALVNALPTWLKDILLTFDVLCTAGGGSSTIAAVPNNRLALRSSTEIGLSSYCFTEGTAIPYYTSSTRNKTIGKNSGSIGSGWWQRSPVNFDSVRYCHEYNGGQSYAPPYSYSRGLSPFGCL